MIKYNSLDGLRGLAIILVILYHYKFRYLEFGYLGVDIFFVLSGFLITQKIYFNMCKEKNLINFYQNRISRLLPSLLVVLFSIIPFYFLFSSEIRLEYSLKSLKYSLIFLSNYFFLYSNEIYGLPDINTLPFLHTWSLSIEWQFYLLFPIIIFIIYRNFAQYINILILLITLLSFCLSYYYFNTNINKFFFHTSTRIWEILIGSLIFLNFNFLIKKFHKFQKLIFVFFILFLLTGISYVSKGQNIFLNCIAVYFTGLIIVFNNNLIIKTIFNNFLLTFFGKISYSLYLWHFPILVLLKYTLEPVTNFKTITIFIITMFISIISYYLIENRFRNSLKFSFKLIFSYILILILAFSSGSFIKHFPNTSFKNLNEDINSYVINHNCTFQIEEINFYDLKKKQFERINKCIAQYKKFVLVIGDSHGEDLFNTFVYYGKHKFVVNYNFGTTPGHKLTPNGYLPIDISKDNYYNFLSFVKIYKNEISSILFTHQRNYLDKDKIINYHQIDQTVKYVMNLRQIIPNTIFFAPHLPANVVIDYYAKDKTKNSLMDSINKDINLIKVDDILSKKIEKLFVSKIKSINYDPDKDFFVNNHYTFSDLDHFSNAGEKYFSKKIFKNIKFKF